MRFCAENTHKHKITDRIVTLNLVCTGSQHQEPQNHINAGNMSSLLRNVTNGIWHAFMALHCDPTAAMVSKSKLKVLTANIAGLFDLYGVERGLEHFRSTAALHFDHFQYYLLQEVFAVLPNAAGLTLAELRNYEARIEEVSVRQSV